VPEASRLGTPTPIPHLPLLRNQNVPGFYVRYYRPFPPVDAEQWTLEVGGLVRNPQELSLPDVLALPRVSQVSRLKCVECWSAAAKWEGFHLSALLALANSHPEAEWLHIHCADGYYESLNMVQLSADRVLFVHHMNDQRLPDIYGAPLRLMVPYLYGYKSAKAIVRLEFARERQVGYWSKVGPYDANGNIRRGRDHPLDLEGIRDIRGGTEIFYPDGIEWQDRERD
jgi:DMSO/TMAO reductase YedYZ molybdopterin-dependent catalytic subunit